jgi:CRP/FNR family transcriptional regulator
MPTQPFRPFVVGDHAAADPCDRCDVRHCSVCAAIPKADLQRLASVAVVREVERGCVFITEGDPADAFFNITGGSAKLFKLLPGGRQQITGFAGVGHFLGLAVSRTYAFSAEAIEPVRLCRFSRPKLRALFDDFRPSNDGCCKPPATNRPQRRTRCCCSAARRHGSALRASCWPAA